MRQLLIALAIVFSVLFAMTGKDVLAGQTGEKVKDATALSGKVVETMDVDRYTYVCLEKNNKKQWLAVPKMKVAVGQSMSFKPGIEMVNFESKTLKRTFDRIIFSQGPVAPEK
jgi:hypothetical protein